MRKPITALCATLVLLPGVQLAAMGGETERVPASCIEQVHDLSRYYRTENRVVIGKEVPRTVLKSHFVKGGDRIFRLGSGGEGTVFRVISPHRDPFLVKRYHSDFELDQRESGMTARENLERECGDLQTLERFASPALAVLQPVATHWRTHTVKFADLRGMDILALRSFARASSQGEGSQQTIVRGVAAYTTQGIRSYRSEMELLASRLRGAGARVDRFDPVGQAESDLVLPSYTIEVEDRSLTLGPEHVIYSPNNGMLTVIGSR